MTKQQRSKNMAAIKSRGNKSTELAFLRILKEHKIKGWRRHYAKLEGKPDFVFPEHRIAVFLDGCFWHACPKCSVIPKSNIEFWNKKIAQNKKRDRLVNRTLKEKGWVVLRIWEHDIKKSPDSVAKKLIRYLRKHESIH